jgi:hypothetical protein
VEGFEHFLAFEVKMVLTFVLQESLVVILLDLALS